LLLEKKYAVSAVPFGKYCIIYGSWCVSPNCYLNCQKSSQLFKAFFRTMSKMKLVSFNFTHHVVLCCQIGCLITEDRLFRKWHLCCIILHNPKYCKSLNTGRASNTSHWPGVWLYCTNKSQASNTSRVSKVGSTSESTF